jgi:hypothetical protein
MEIFCTPLQCRVDLNVFHSSTTSKIWHTSIEHDVHYDGAKPQSCVVEKICTTGSQRSAVFAGHIGRKLFFELQTL